MAALKPPGAYYANWSAPGPRLLADGLEAGLSLLQEEHGEDSVDAAMVNILHEYSDVYGPGGIPMLAALHLDTMSRAFGLAEGLAGNVGVDDNEALRSLHSLHAQGMLLVRDDGSVWMTIPPGTPYSKPSGAWDFVEERLPATPELVS